MADIIIVLEAIGTGAAAAAIAAGVGYAKAYFAKAGTDKPEAFDAEKFGSTVALGAVLGGVGGYFGVSPLQAQDLLVNFGIFTAVVYFVDAGVKTIVRFIKRKLAK